MTKLFGDCYKGMFLISVLVMIGLVIFAIAVPDTFTTFWNGLNNGIVINFGWWYAILANSVCFFLLFLLVSKYGKLRIGKMTDRPEHSTFSWIAMLFSSNVGVGLIFWGVAEPILHLIDRPYLFADPATETSLTASLSISTAHWGIVAWGPCTLAALAIGFAAYRHGKPLTMAGALYGVLGDKVHGPWGKVIDTLSVIATIAGICTTIGLGVMSVAYGANYMFGIENSVMLNIVILVLVVATFLLSSSVGIGRGIKRLSTANVYLSIAMMVFILVFGPTRFILNATVTNIGGYLDNFFQVHFFLDTVGAGEGWLNSWTIFYWGWWLCWTPFVGGFIAKISKGRTIREFIMGALIAPTILTVLWFGILGGAAIFSEINNIAPMYETISQYSESGLYVLFSTYPFGIFLSLLVLVNMIIFVCTSADAASFYCAACINKGSVTPHVATKVLMGIIIGISGLVLMQTGGLKSLQTVSIVCAFPFSFIVALMPFSTMKMLNKEYLEVFGDDSIPHKLPEETEKTTA